MPSRARKHQLAKALVFHAYNRSNFSVPIFSQQDEFEHFMKLLKRYSREFLLKIYHWVIMNTHFHLLFSMADPRQISSLMAGLNRAYTHYYHKANQTHGLLWQGRFGMQPVQKDPYLMACGRYIERNPVRAKLVQDAYEYPFSSARFYCIGLQDGITYEDPTFQRLGKDIDERRTNYIAYLRDFSAEEEELFRNCSSPVGNEYFRSRLWLINGRCVPRGRGKPPGANKRVSSLY